MATRREFRKSSAGIASALSGTGAVSLAAERKETAPDKGEQKRANPEDKRPPLRLHLLGCGYPSPY